jgi:hypothetical protein
MYENVSIFKGVQKSTMFIVRSMAFMCAKGEVINIINIVDILVWVFFFSLPFHQPAQIKVIFMLLAYFIQ